MKLAIFDLDNTLIGGDSDHAWGEFLVENNIVDSTDFKNANDQFYQDYCEGKLDILAYLRFALTPLSKFSAEELSKLHARFMKDKIEPLFLPKAKNLVEEHRKNGDVLLVITATNRFVTQPIVERYGIEHLLASDGEIENERYTGEPGGTPCFAEGKITRLKAWLETQPVSVQNCERVFYSDSRNDIPLLSQVDTPVAVDPDDVLKQHAQANNWEILSLR